MLKKHMALGAYLIALLFAGCPAVFAQAPYPSKLIRFIAGGAGGSSDFAARVLAQQLTGNLGQQVIVENRPGGNGIIQAQTVVKAPADGYTLGVCADQIWLLPLTQDNVPYDPIKDFAPISVIGRSPTALVVHPSLPVKSVRELITLAKARPGELHYSRSSSGSSPHLSAELLKSMAGLNIAGVAYRAGPDVILAVASGEIAMTFATFSTGEPLIKSKRVRALAVSTIEPSRLFPGVPTMSASGFPGFESVIMTGLLAPAGTPAALINRLNQEVVRVLRTAEAKERFFVSGVETAGTTPEELDSVIKSEMAKWGKLIKLAKIRSD